MSERNECKGTEKRAKHRGGMYGDCPVCGERVPLTLGGLISRHSARAIKSARSAAASLESLMAPRVV